MQEDIIAEVSSKISLLPLDKQIEVLDFINFMLHKHKTQAGNQLKRSYRSTRGLFATSGVKITEGDIAEIRHEMWAGFPREDPPHQH